METLVVQLFGGSAFVFYFSSVETKKEKGYNILNRI